MFDSLKIISECKRTLKKYNIKDVWHGHIHGAGKQYITTDYMGVSFHLISCDCVDFTPVLIK